MLKRLTAKVVILGALVISLLFGGFAVAGATAPAAHAWGGCFGWNGIFINASWCDGYGYGGGYPGVGYPGYGYGGYPGYYPPPPPPPPPPAPYYPAYGGGCGCHW